VFLPPKFPADLGRAVLKLYAPESLADKGKKSGAGVPPTFTCYLIECLSSAIAEGAVCFPIIGRLLEISVADPMLAVSALLDGAEAGIGVGVTRT
jgi:hypothetical protein